MQRSRSTAAVSASLSAPSRGLNTRARLAQVERKLALHWQRTRAWDALTIEVATRTEEAAKRCGLTLTEQALAALHALGSLRRGLSRRR